MRHRWKWISALILIAIVGFGWRLWQRPAPRAPGPVAAAPAPEPLPTSLAPAPAIMSRAVRSRVAAGTARQRDSGETEICGAGKINLDRDDPTAPGKYFDALTKNSRLRWLSALRGSDDYRARAAGLYLKGILDRDSPQKDPEAARDELVQLAVGTKDPAAFALAYTKCGNGVGGLASQGACPQLNLDDWTRADADNAVPWLQLAAKARRENDRAAEAAAFAHAAQTHHYDSYNWSLFSFAQPALPDDVSAADRWFLSVEIIGVEAAMPMPYLPLFQYCSRDALNDATIHAQCNALAELMVSKATTLLDLSAGKSLGARLGWPAARVDKLTLELKASMQVLNQIADSDPRQQWSCENVARGNAYMSQLDTFGERGLTKQGIERSGETIAELSRKFDEEMAARTTKE